MKVGQWRVGPGRVAVALAAVLAVGAGGWWVRSRRPEGPLERGLAAYGRGDWEASRASARQRLLVAPNDPEALRLLARSMSRLGRDESAQAIYQRLGMDAMRGEDFYVLGTGLVRQEKIVPAIQVMNRGLRVEPRHPELLQELSRLFAHQGDLSPAVTLAGRLAGVPGWEARGDLIAGILRAEDADPAASAASLEKALARDPALRGGLTTPAEARKLIARARLRLGQAAAARTALGVVLAAGPDPEASWLLSRVCLQQGDAAGASAALERSQGYGADTAATPEPAPFVGAAKCAECHKAIHASQQQSHHARTFAQGSGLDRLNLPDRPVADSLAPGVVHTMDRRGGRVEATTRVDGATYRAVVEYALGSGNRGVTLVGRDDAGRSRELRLSQYSDGSGWDVTIGQQPHARTAADYLGLPLGVDEVNACVHCHTTDSRAARGRLEPLAADHGIGCERCHGPGGNHVAAMALEFPDLAVARPHLFTAERQVKLCAQCHSPKGNVVVRLDDPTTVRFQAIHFVKSRCYTESNGALSCVTCHSPHRDAETSAGFYESRCLACHGAGPAAAPLKGGETMHRVSCPVNPVNGCLTCHMPVEKVAIPHVSFSDHNIRVHRDKAD